MPRKVTQIICLIIVLISIPILGKLIFGDDNLQVNTITHAYAQTITPTFSTSFISGTGVTQQSRPVVIQLIYADASDSPKEAQSKLNQLAAWLDIWHVDPDTRTLTTMVWPEELAKLIADEYHLEIVPSPIQTLDPDGYPCYRTVEELYATLEQTVTISYPDITQLADYGDSWEKTMPGGQAGYDLYVLEITNKAIPGPKPVTVIDGGTHAREMTPPELAMALVDFLTSNYGQDPDVTWLVDHHKTVILPMVNPDGHKHAEAGKEWWRKNTDNDDGCSDPNRWGTNLNRNFDFKWNCCGGSSNEPCDSIYHGPAPLSEPEVEAYASYVRSQIPDQWDYNDALSVPAPVTTTGMLVNMHSYDPSIIYPWGWTSDPAPNDTGLKAIADKWAAFNGYPVRRSLYQVDGIIRDWGYGDLGIPSFALELGTAYLQSCDDLPVIINDNLPGLYYLIRIARTPYTLIHGPDVISPTLAPTVTVTARPVQVNAIIDDTENGGDSIAAAIYYVDSPPWITTTIAISHPMTATDGIFDEIREDVQANLDICNLSSGRHILFIQGQDANGNWGPFWATWVTVPKCIHLPLILKG
jgi:hypothetical protein